MRGFLKALAFLAAIFLVLVTVLVLFISNLAWVVTNREAMKRALNGDELLSQVVTAVVRDGLAEQLAAVDLPLMLEESAAFEAAVTAAVPPGWAAAQTDAIIDALFDYLETGDESALVITVQTEPLLRSLRGEPGRQLVQTLLESLPPCTDEIPNIDLATGQIEIPGCLPPFIPLDLLADQLHGSLVAVIDQNAGQALLGEGLTFSLLGEEGVATAEVRQSLEQLRQLYLWGRRGAWLLWLIPLATLFLILLLAVRSPGGWGHWWGWPLLAAALFGLALSFVLPSLLGTPLGVMSETVPAEGRELAVGQYLRSLLETLTGIWLGGVRLQAGLLAIVGFFLAASGFILDWMLARE